MSKTPDTIQQRALSTWYDPDHELHNNLLPSVMGLAGESGELLDLVKKIHFKPGFRHSVVDLYDELGDVLYYAAILAHQLNITLDELSRLNYAKLTKRERDGAGYNKGID
jgi:NTP pyrophosphatase (non-canonical NTP hydrolase)